MKNFPLEQVILGRLWNGSGQRDKMLPVFKDAIYLKVYTFISEPFCFPKLFASFLLRIAMFFFVFFLQPQFESFGRRLDQKATHVNPLKLTCNSRKK